MPIQEAPLRVFWTFICIKRIPPPPLFYYVPPHHLRLHSLASLFATLPTFASFYIRYLKALPLSVLSPPFYLGSARVGTRCFAFIHPSAPLHCTFQPYPLATPVPLRHILLISPLCFAGAAEEELECLLYARISLLNLVLQVTILLLSPRFLHAIFLVVIQHFYCFSLTPLCS